MRFSTRTGRQPLGQVGAQRLIPAVRGALRAEEELPAGPGRPAQARSGDANDIDHWSSRHGGRPSPGAARSRPFLTSPPRPGRDSRVNTDPTRGQIGHIKNYLEWYNPRS